MTTRIGRWTRIKHDINGNPRHVTSWTGYGFDNYGQALRAAHKMGGGKFNNKQFGGGIVFQSYECELPRIEEYLTKAANAVLAGQRPMGQ